MWIENVNTLLAKLHIIAGSLREKGNLRSASLVIEGAEALRDALPVIEAAMEDIPCTGPIGESAWLKRLDAALTPWKEKEEDAQS